MQDRDRPAQLEIALDESRIARGSVDSYSVRVRVRWRVPESTQPVVTLLDDLPEPVDVVSLRRDDGEIELVPKSWQGSRFGNGPTLYEMARRTPGGLGPVPQVREAIEHAEQLLAAYRPDFTDYTVEEKIQLVLGVIDRVNDVAKRLTRLEGYLEFADPGRKAVPYIEDPERDVMAAIISEVLGLGSRGVGEVLGIPAEQSSDIKGENRAARRAARRGRILLEYRFGSEGWASRVERMRRLRRRWLELEDDPRQQFFMLLAELRNTSVEEEQRLAAGDGFMGVLDRWARAFEEDDLSTAVCLQREDARFGALRRL
jgi:hypothetical protein